MEIYIVRNSPLLEEGLFQKMLHAVPKERQMKIGRIHGTRDRCRSLGAGLLLEYGLNQQGISLLDDGQRGRKAEIAYTGQGKPCISGHPKICFNLSHSGEYAAAVFAGSETGIDLEEIRNAGRSTKIARRFFMPEESACLEQLEGTEKTGTVFTALWTRKESYIKAVGAGLSLPMNTFSVLKDEVIREQSAGEADVDSPSYYLKTFYLPKGYCLSVCSLERPDVHPIELKLSEII